jgi:hypothetical protein
MGRPGLKAKAIPWALLVATTVILNLGRTADASSDVAPAPYAPVPELCLAPPRSFDDLISLAATPSTGTPEPTPTPGPIPEGTPADLATSDAVTATVRELVACFNAGELLRAYGLYSDHYLHRLLSRQDLTTRAAYDSLSTPMPSTPDERAQILDIRGVRLLSDGRVGALVTIKYTVVPVPKTFFFVFVESDGEWSIDDIRGEISFSLP